MKNLVLLLIIVYIEFYGFHTVFKWFNYVIFKLPGHMSPLTVHGAIILGCIFVADRNFKFKFLHSTLALIIVKHFQCSVLKMFNYAPSC